MKIEPVLTAETLREAKKIIMESKGKPDNMAIAVSQQAYDMAIRIFEIDPHFFPLGEHHIWLRALELGLK